MLLSLFFYPVQCFYIPKCRKDYAAMQVLVQNISERLRSQHTLQCFVDRTDKTDSAILTQIYSQSAVFHSLFWPTCTLIGGSVIIAMVKLTQYLSVVCDRLSRIKRWRVSRLHRQGAISRVMVSRLKHKKAEMWFVCGSWHAMTRTFSDNHKEAFLFVIMLDSSGACG